MNERVVAVVVCYNPNVRDLEELLESVSPQVSNVVVVSNSSSLAIRPIIAQWINVDLIQMFDNVGVAAAQNVGIDKAMLMSADFVLLLDQDSLPSRTMVSELLCALRSAEGSVAAVGPAIIDRRTRHFYHFIVERNGFPGKYVSPLGSDVGLIDVAVLAASGTLIPLNILKRVGRMRPNYFVDHVDTEWCFRVRALGFKLIAVSHTTLEHQFGDAVSEAWFFGYHRIIHHSPLRSYYDIRNTLLMFKENIISVPWKVFFIKRLLRLGYFLIFDGSRVYRMLLIGLGLFHGLKSISGRLEVNKTPWFSMKVTDVDSLIPSKDAAEL